LNPGNRKKPKPSKKHVNTRKYKLMRDTKGRFQPGASGNPAGRPNGAKNKAGREIKETLAEGLAARTGRYFEELDKLEGLDYVKEFRAGCSIVTTKETAQKIDLSRMTEEQAAAVILEIISEDEEE
jgi:hypothetical protein